MLLWLGVDMCWVSPDYGHTSVYASPNTLLPVLAGIRGDLSSRAHEELGQNCPLWGPFSASPLPDLVSPVPLPDSPGSSSHPISGALTQTTQLEMGV